MKLIFAIFCFLPALVSAQAKTRILFILDASNSMNARWDTETRIQVAKALLIKAVDSIKSIPNLEIGLRVYGHQSPITATFQDCADTKLEVPFAANNFEAVKAKIKTILAKGTTPIARSLEAAAGDFPDTKANNVIILITDGLEACDNDPCVIAKKLKDKGINVTPFVIGLGMDLSYLEKFNCIGTFLDAENRQTFTRVLNFAISKAIINTSAQINLNNLSKQPLETEVTMFFYKAGTKELKYTFLHTLNRTGLPDTLIIDPGYKYDIVVNTIPIVEKKNVELQYKIHNTIIIDAPQGYIQTKLVNGQRQYEINTRIYLAGQEKTLNVQALNSKDKYLVGEYKIEILTLPRIYKTITVSQSGTTVIDINAPGMLSYKQTSDAAAQIFSVSQDGNIVWVCNMEQNKLANTIQLQPGNYKLIYRLKKLRSTTNTTERLFKIESNKTTTINL